MAAIPRVSVVIPAYNAADRLGGALRSVLDQSLGDVEAIVVDDASTDRTPAVARAAAAADPRVRVLRTARNLGPGEARNLGLGAARGDWVALLDADDGFLPERLERLVAFGEAADADAVADNLLLLDAGQGDGGEAAPVPMLSADALPAPHRVDAVGFLRGNLPIRGQPRVSYGFLKPMFRRAFLERHGLRYEPGMRFAEDFVFYMACLVRGARLWLVPEAMYRYTLRGDSLTAAHGLAELRRLRAADAALLRDPRVQGDRRLRRAVARHARSIDERIAWRAFTDAIKARDLGGVLGAPLAGGFRGALHIPTEGLRALPRLLRKRPRAAPPASRGPGAGAWT